MDLVRRIIAFNANSPLGPGKSLASAAFSHEQEIDICITTEPHVRSEELERLRFEGLGDFEIVGDHCSDFTLGRVTVGAAAIVRADTGIPARLPATLLRVEGANCLVVPSVPAM